MSRRRASACFDMESDGEYAGVQKRLSLMSGTPVNAGINERTHEGSGS